ncbi:MAG: polysaccharide lyase [Myxococcaceae bacterium]|nr:polysaccharide lyase [Myxococcaceae bacterium]
MTALRIMLLGVALTLLPHDALAQWAHQPTNAQVLVDCAFTAGQCTNQGMLDYSVNAPLPYTNDVSAPISPSGVGVSRLIYPNTSGGSQWGYYANAVIRSLYVGLEWRTNSGFTGNNVGQNKTFFMRGNGYGNTPFNAGVFILTKDKNASSGVLTWHQNTGGLDNGHVCPPSPGSICFPNLTATPIVVGQWYKLEAIVTASTCNTCRDGRIELWVNDVKNFDLQNFNYGGGNVNEFIWTETWDGVSAGAGFLATAEHYFDHLRVAAVNCSPNCGSGERDTTPPGQVTNLTVSQLTR